MEFCALQTSYTLRNRFERACGDHGVNDFVAEPPDKFGIDRPGATQLTRISVSLTSRESALVKAMTPTRCRIGREAWQASLAASDTMLTSCPL